MCKLIGTEKPCEFILSGLKSVKLAIFEKDLEIEDLGGGYYIANKNIDFTDFWFVESNSSFSESMPITQNGANFQISLTLGFLPLSQDNMQRLKVFKDKRIIADVVDRNDRRWLIGYENGLRLTEYNATTAVYNELNEGYILTWIGTGINGIVEIKELEIPPIPDTQRKHYTFHFRDKYKQTNFQITDVGIFDVELIDVFNSMTGTTYTFTSTSVIFDICGNQSSVINTQPVDAGQASQLLTGNLQPVSIIINAGNYNSAATSG